MNNIISSLYSYTVCILSQSTHIYSEYTSSCHLNTWSPRIKCISPSLKFFIYWQVFVNWSLYSSLPRVFCWNCSFYNLSISKYTNCEIHDSYTQPIYLISLLQNCDKNSNRGGSRVMSEQSCSICVYHKIELFSTRSGFIQQNTITNCEICSCAAK